MCWGRNGIGGGTEGRVMVRSKGCKEGSCLRTFSPPTPPRRSGSGRQVSIKKGMGVKVPRGSVTIRRLGVLCCALGTKAVTGARKVGPGSRRAQGGWL